MSLIIKGMEIPPKCRSCPCCADDGLVDFCSAVDTAVVVDNLDQKLSCCPLVEIPTPHGRLIDADKLLEAMSQAVERDRHWVNFFGIVDESPTIIEAKVSE